jgi:MarC family membrane protein
MPAWISAFVLILLVLDPLGNVPVILALMRPVPPERRRRVILRECALALAVLLLFLAFGDGLLRLLGLSQSSIGIAGGIILFLIAVRMVFESSEKVFGGLPQGEPLIVPIAVPILAGPSALATVILLGTRQSLNPVQAAGAILLAMAASTAVLLQATSIVRWLGERGVEAMQRLMGLLLTAIAVEMFLKGLSSFMHAPATS